MDAERLRAQVASAVATGRCACGCASIHLDVEHTPGVAARTPSPVPVQPQIVGDDGQPVGGVLLFLEDGWLSYLEVYSYHEPIPRFPSTDRLASMSRVPWNFGGGPGMSVRPLPPPDSRTDR
jgi:hypothetical protein